MGGATCAAHASYQPCTAKFSKQGVPMRVQIAIAVLLSSIVVSAQVPVHPTAAHPAQAPWSSRAADAAISDWPTGDVMGKGAPRWVYEEATLLNGMTEVWRSTANPKYYNYIK